jgi:hypothetical protein
VVELPPGPTPEEVAARTGTPWYKTLWTDLTAGAPK